MKKSLFPLFALWLLVVMACVCNKTDFAPRTNEQSNQPPIEIPVNDLVRAYTNNEVAADEKYKGRTLKVTGNIDTIGKDIVDSPYVTFESVSIIPTVQCMFGSKDIKELAGVRKGQRLTVKGRCDGKFGNVILRECQIVSE